MNDKVSEYTRLAVRERKAAARARSAAEAALLQDIANQYDVMAEKAAGRPTLTPHYGV